MSASPTLVPPGRRAPDLPWILLGSSQAARRLRETLERVAQTPATTVRVDGARDLARDAVARAIHLRSARCAGPYLRLRAAGLSPEELERGLERAAGGTLAVDEVGELEPATQASLAAILTESRHRTGDSVGGTRLVATSERDLEREVEAGRLDAELGYRLNVLSLQIPALAQRREDLPLLARHVLAELARDLGRSFAAPDAALEAALVAHDWPGGLRELVNALERAALRAHDGALDAIELALPRGVRTGGEEPPATLPLGDRSLRAVEEALIRRVLDETRGNKARAARLLGVDRTTLYNKLRQYGV